MEKLRNIDRKIEKYKKYRGISAEKSRNIDGKIEKYRWKSREILMENREILMENREISKNIDEKISAFIS